MPRSHTVICTAGHIDHGKSSLVFALTGHHPDVLREEQEREMTIELGFAFYGDRVTFIDVPGHEKFLRTMLAGVSSVDGAILVVAADDGVMPQTREHFEVLKILGIPRGIVALTKIDAAEPDWMDLVEEEIRALTGGSFMADAPILRVSNRTGAGMEQLKAALGELIASAKPRTDRGLFRMWNDRAFTIKGAGTVVAGTVLSGSVKAGDQVEILPEGVKARVKRIQVHNQDVPEAFLGERTALNLPGVDKDAVKRGHLLATPNHYRPTFMLNARLSALPSLPHPIEHRTRLRLHLGSSEHICRAVLLEGHPIPPGGSGLVQFRLEDQGMADIGDRYVVRGFSDGRVAGGGALLEIHPAKAKSADRAELERLARLESAEPAEVVRQFLTRTGEKCADAAETARELALPLEQAVDIICALERDGQAHLLQGEPRWLAVDAARFGELTGAVLKVLDEFHRDKPNLKGMRRSEVKARLMPQAPGALLDNILLILTGEGKVEVEGELVRLAGHKVRFTAGQEELKQRIVSIYRERLFVTPEPADLAGELGLTAGEVEPVLTGLCELGELVKLYGPDAKPLYYHRDGIEAARRKCLEFFKSHAEMRFFEFRELIGSTRKFTTPILEHFDAMGLTRRDGDVRRLVV